MENKTDPTLSDLSGKDNWEKRFNKLLKNVPKGNFFKGYKTGAQAAVQWLKIYSPLNPRYEQPQEIK